MSRFFFSVAILSAAVLCVAGSLDISAMLSTGDEDVIMPFDETRSGDILSSVYLPGDGEQCNLNRGTCRVRESCPGGKPAGNWWSGHCKGIYYCCKPGTNNNNNNNENNSNVNDNKRVGIDEDNDIGGFGPRPGPRSDVDGVDGSDTVESFFWPGQKMNQPVLGWKSLFKTWADYLDKTMAEKRRTKSWTATNNVIAAHWQKQLSEIPTDKVRAFKANRVFGITEIVRYRADSISFSTSDFWATPMEMFSFFESQGASFGDCEDYATLRYLSLRQLGVPASAMRIAVITTPEGAHAVLVVRLPENGQHLVLDNQRRFAIGLTDVTYPTTDYGLIYSVNEDGVWIHKSSRKRKSTSTEDILLSSGNEADMTFPITKEADLANAKEGVAKAIAAYAIGSASKSLAYARIVGVPDATLRPKLDPVWRSEECHELIDVLTRVITDFAPTKSNPLPSLSGQDRAIVDAKLREVSEIANRSNLNEKLYEKPGAEGLLQASYINYLLIDSQAERGQKVKL